MAHDPFLSPQAARPGLSLAQREFRRREVVRGVVATLFGLGAVGAMLPLFGLWPGAPSASVGRAPRPQGAAHAAPQPKPSSPGTLSLTEQLLPPPSPLGQGQGDTPFVVPAGQVVRPRVAPGEYGRPHAWRPAPPRLAPPLRPARALPRPVPAQGGLVPVAPQHRGDALDPLDATGEGP